MQAGANTLRPSVRSRIAVQPRREHRLRFYLDVPAVFWQLFELIRCQRDAFTLALIAWLRADALVVVALGIGGSPRQAGARIEFQLRIARNPGRQRRAIETEGIAVRSRFFGFGIVLDGEEQATADVTLNVRFTDLPSEHGPVALDAQAVDGNAQRKSRLFDFRLAGAVDVLIGKRKRFRQREIS